MMAGVGRLRAVLWPALVLLCLTPVALGQDDGGPESPDAPLAVVLQVEGPIGPATAGYLKDGLATAAERGAAIAVLRMNTPGGLSASMREIIQAILRSPVPVATYVAPTGARAASAGTYILYASHVAAMAPGTTLGAATPVQMGGGPLPGGDGNPSSDGEGQPADPKTAKAVNDAVAYIRALANQRGRNADWGEQAVREAATLTAEAAVERNVADLLAKDVPALLDAVDGREVTVNDRPVTLATAGAEVEHVEPDWRDELLAILTNPNVAFIFMMIGVYGLIFELANPGAVVPGVIGAVCLLIGLYALNVLPVNYAGLALLALGVALMVGEAFAPAFGALGLGGIVAFALGATILFDTQSPAFALSYWTIAGVTATTGAILVLLIGYLVKAQRRPVTTGEHTLVGKPGEVESWSQARGRVRVDGELWQAEGPRGLKRGHRVRVVGFEGLTLTVRPDGEDTTAGESP